MTTMSEALEKALAEMRKQIPPSPKPADLAPCGNRMCYCTGACRVNTTNNEQRSQSWHSNKNAADAKNGSATTGEVAKDSTTERRKDLSIWLKVGAAAF